MFQTRQEMWRQLYRSRPYLQYSTEKEVAERLRYVIENMMILTAGGKIGPLPPEPRGKYWYELFEHALEEYRRRHYQPPAGFLKGAQVVNPAAPLSAAALKAIQGVTLPAEGTYVVKLGRRAHMSDFLEQGRLRIAPAGTYADPSLNSAIRDDELSLSSFGQQSEVLIEVFDPKTGLRNDAMRPIGNLIYTSRSKTDYYVLCVTTGLDARLFDDFGYDSCLIIRDLTEFKRRLTEAVTARLQGWISAAGPVRYVDPFNCTKDDMNVFMGKHLKYSYQQEYRYIWLPQNLRGDRLEPLFVELGSMREIADLVSLE